MKITESMVTASQDAREQVIEVLAESKRKAFLQDVLGNIEFIGDEIPRTELERVFEISKRTATAFINKNREELDDHGYRVVRGKNEVNALVKGMEVSFHTLGNTTQLGLFTIDAALSFGMVLTESEPAARLRTALIELTKEATPEQLATAAVRSWELEDFRETWSIFSRLEGFNRSQVRTLHSKILIAVTGLGSQEIKSSREMVRAGDKRTARNYLNDEELYRASTIERGVCLAIMGSSNFREAYTLASVMLDHARSNAANN